MKNKLSLNRNKLLRLQETDMAALFGGEETFLQPDETSCKTAVCFEDDFSDIL